MAAAKKAPVAKAPVAKAPVAKAPVAKAPKPTAAETKAKNDAIKAGKQSEREAAAATKLATQTATKAKETEIRAAKKVKQDADAATKLAKKTETRAANKVKADALAATRLATKTTNAANTAAAKAKRQADWDLAHPVAAANRIAKEELKKRDKIAKEKIAYDKSPAGKWAAIQKSEKDAADKITAATKVTEDKAVEKAVEKTRQDDITTQAKIDAITPASSNPYAMESGGGDSGGGYEGGGGGGYEGGGGGGIMSRGPAGSGAQIQTRPTFAMPRGIDAAYVNDIRSKLMPVRDSALSPANTMKNGGKVAAKAFAKGGIVRSAKPAAKTTSKPAAKMASRGDGCAQRGKTKGKYC